MFKDTHPTLTLAEIEKKLNEMNSGRFATVTFYSAPKTVDGTTIYKVTKMQTQTKVDYTAKKDYVEPTYNVVRDEEYTIDRALKHNNNTNNDLLILYPFGDRKANVSYFEEDGTEIDTETAKSRIKPKTPSKTPLVYMTVNAKNVIEICGG